MKLKYRTGNPGRSLQRRGTRAFTLTEMLIASTIFMLLVAGIVSSNIFGLRMLQLTEPKQQAAGRARELINELSQDISEGWLVEVGSDSGSGFSPVPPLQVKQGNALKISYGSDTNDFVVYYHDAGADELIRYTSAAPSGEVMAWGVTNPVVFTGEVLDLGLNTWVPLQGSRTTMAIRVSLQFSELERTRTPIGPDYIYKGYQFQSRLIWRAR
jgi:hypothetical protein